MTTTDTSLADRSPATFDDDQRPRRDNYWGKDDDEDVVRGHDDKGRPDWSAQIAHGLIKEVVPKYCSTTLNDAPYNGGRLAEQVAWLEADCDHDLATDDMAAAIDRSDLIDGRAWAMHHENRHVELTDSEYYPAKNMDGWSHHGTARYHASRINPETGYLNFDETTSVELGRVAWADLAYCIRVYAHREDLAEWKVDRMLEISKSMHHDPVCDKSGLDILAEVLEKNNRDELER